MGEDETVQHVILQCEKYGRDRTEMMRVILPQLGCNMNEMVEQTGREWMVLLLGLCRETYCGSERVLGENVVCQVYTLQVYAGYCWSLFFPLTGAAVIKA